MAQSIDLERVGRLPHCKFDIATYHCAYVKSPKMHSKVSVFRTGKMISIGTRTEKQAAEDLNYVCDFLTSERLIKHQKLDPKTRNIVASLEVGHSIELETIASKVPYVIYEPEQFPGAIYRPRDPLGVSILLFASGKAVIAGAKTLYQIKVAAEEIARLSERYESKAAVT